MPTVPRYGDVRVREAPDPSPGLPGVPSVEAFGGGRVAGAPAEAIRGAAGAVSNLAEKARQDADQMSFLDADRKLSAEEPRHKIALEAAKGMNAIPAADQSMADFDKFAGELSGSIPSAKVRDAFQRSYQSRRNDLGFFGERHVRREVEATYEANSKAYIETELTAIATDYQNPERVQTGKDRIRGAIRDRAVWLGIDPNGVWAQAMTTNAIADANKAVIERMLGNGQDVAAQAYYEENKDGFGRYIAQVEKMLEIGSREGAAQRKTDEILGSVGTIRESMASAKDIGDSKIRGIVEQNLRHHFSDQKALESQEQEQAFEQAFDEVTRTGSLSALSPALRGRLDSTQERALEARASEISKEEGPPKQDDEAWAGDGGAYYLTGEELLALKPSDFQAIRQNLTGAHRTEIENRRELAAKSAKKDANAGAELTRLESDRDELLRAMNGAGMVSIPVVGKDRSTVPGFETNEQFVNAFTGMAETLVNRFERTALAGKNRKASPEERQKIIDGLIIDIRLGGAENVLLKGQRGQYGGEQGKEVSSFFMGDISGGSVPGPPEPEPVPTDSWERIENELAIRNRPVTDEKIRAIYRAMQVNDHTRVDTLLAD